MPNTEAPAPNKISWLTLAFLNVAAIASIRGLPSMAEYGLGSVFFYLVPAIVFLVPTALVAAELATGWKGGVFVWVSEALSARYGFVSIWLQWIQNVIWYPVVLSFAAGALAYIINPDLASSGIYTAIVILAVYLVATLIALRGLNLSSIFGSWGMIIGTLTPAAILAVLGVLFLARGDQSAAPMTASHMVPDLARLSNLVLVVGTFLSFAGMEMNAVHARDTKNPRRAFPKAMMLSGLLTLLIFIPPTLAVAFVVPAHELSLTAGVMQAYEAFFRIFGLEWATRITAVALIVGAFAGVITWVAGPSRGLLLVGQHGYLPRYFQRTNARGVQSHILAVQGAIVGVLALLFVFVPNVSSGFWMLSAMAAQLYLVMYVLMFVSALLLRKKKPDVVRGYRTPAMPLVAGVGIAASITAFFFGFVPPSQFGTGSPIVYVAIISAGILILGGAPLLIFALRRDSWEPDEGVAAATAGAAGTIDDDDDHAPDATVSPQDQSTQ